MPTQGSCRLALTPCVSALARHSIEMSLLRITDKFLIACESGRSAASDPLRRRVGNAGPEAGCLREWSEVGVDLVGVGDGELAQGPVSSS